MKIKTTKAKTRKGKLERTSTKYKEDQKSTRKKRKIKITKVKTRNGKSTEKTSRDKKRKEKDSKDM